MSMPSELMRVNVGSIATERLPYGLLSAAVDVVDPMDPRQIYGVNWPQVGCGPSGFTSWCPAPGDPEVEPKAPTRMDWASTGPAVIYYMADCSAVGTTVEEVRENARIGLDLGEQRGIEQYVMSELLAPEAVVVTPPTGPLPIVQTVGILEGELASRYGGVGVLHAPAAVSALLAAGHQFDTTRDDADRVRRTWLGNRIALGAGYQLNLGPPDTPDGDPVEAPAGQVWLYITGPVVVRLGAVQPHEASTRGMDLQDNNLMALAERAVVVQIACVTLAALATFSTDC